MLSRELCTFPWVPLWPCVSLNLPLYSELDEAFIKNPLAFPLTSRYCWWKKWASRNTNHTVIHFISFIYCYLIPSFSCSFFLFIFILVILVFFYSCYFPCNIFFYSYLLLSFFFIRVISFLSFSFLFFCPWYFIFWHFIIVFVPVIHFILSFRCVISLCYVLRYCASLYFFSVCTVIFLTVHFIEDLIIVKFRILFLYTNFMSCNIF